MSEEFSGRMTLGASELQVSLMGIGTNAWGFNRLADPGKQATFDAILENGINLIDTAEVYHFGGSERTLGLFLQNLDQKPVVATKFFPLPWRLNRASLIAALQKSLERLKIPRVDLYMLHFPVPPVPLEKWINALGDAQEAGLIRAIGISNCNLNQMRKANAALAARGLTLASNQVEYSLLSRNVEYNGLLSLCHELGITLIAYRPIGYGLLSGKYSPENPPAWLHGRRYNRAHLQRIAPLLTVMREIAHGRGKTPTQVALNWVICKGALPIPGAKNPRQVVDNAGALGWRLNAAEIDALDKVSFEIHW